MTSASVLLKLKTLGDSDDDDIHVVRGGGASQKNPSDTPISVPDNGAKVSPSLKINEVHQVGTQRSDLASVLWTSSCRGILLN